MNSFVLLESELYYGEVSLKDGILLDLKFLKKETRGSGICSLSFLENYRRIAIFEETTNSRVGRQKQLKECAQEGLFTVCLLFPAADPKK